MKKVLSLFLVAVMVALSLGTLSAMAMSTETVEVNYSAIFVAQEAIKNNALVTDNEGAVETSVYGSDSNRMSYALYKFDISKFQEPITSANLTVGLKCTAGSGKTASYRFYIVDSTTWSGWETSTIDIAGFAAGTTAAETLTIDNGASGNHTVSLNADAVAAINNAIGAKTGHVIFCVQQYEKATSTSRGMYNVYYGDQKTEYLPKLEAVAKTENVIYDENLSFYNGKSITVDREALIKVTATAGEATVINNRTASTEVAEGESASVQYPGARFQYLLYRVNLAGVTADDISAATLRLYFSSVYYNAASQVVDVFAVDNDTLNWSSSKDLADTDLASLVSTYFDTSLATFNPEEFVDLYESTTAKKAYINRCIDMPLGELGAEAIKTAVEDGYVTLAVRWGYYKNATATNNNLTIASMTNTDAANHPKLILTKDAVSGTTISAAAGGSIVAKAGGVAYGTDAKYIRPIIAVYDAENNMLVEVKYGNAVKVESGVALNLETSIDGYESGNKVKTFLWVCDNIGDINVVPYAESIELTVTD